MSIKLEYLMMIDMFDRISKSYLLSRSSQENSEDLYGSHWKRYYSDLEEKWSRALSSLQNSLENFRARGGLSSGLDDASDVNAAGMTIGAFRMVDAIGMDFINENIPKKNIGNCPFTFPLLGHTTDLNTISHLYYAKGLDDLIFSKPFLGEKAPNIICEIGGGYGGMARIIVKRTSAKYLIIDLPEANMLSTYYLSLHFPGKKFYLYSDYIEGGKKIDSSVIEDNDFIILPPGCFYDDSVKVGLFINMRSMGEMEQHSVGEYFDFIHAHISESGIFANFNRLQKVTSLIDYPYDAQWRSFLCSQVPLQQNIYALVCQREFDPERQNIESVISRLRPLEDPLLALNRQRQRSN